MTPALPPGFKLDPIPDLPTGFKLDPVEPTTKEGPQKKDDRLPFGVPGGREHKSFAETVGPESTLGKAATFLGKASQYLPKPETIMGLAAPISEVAAGASATAKAGSTGTTAREVIKSLPDVPEWAGHLPFVGRFARGYRFAKGLASKATETAEEAAEGPYRPKASIKAKTAYGGRAHPEAEYGGTRGPQRVGKSVDARADEIIEKNVKEPLKPKGPSQGEGEGVVPIGKLKIRADIFAGVDELARKAGAKTGAEISAFKKAFREMIPGQYGGRTLRELSEEEHQEVANNVKDLVEKMKK